MSAQSIQMPALGNRVEEYPSVELTGELLGMALGFVMVVGSLIYMSAFYEPGGSGFPMAICLVGAAIVAFSAMGLPRAIKNRRLKVTLFDQGFVYGGGKNQWPVRWEDIAAVRHTYRAARRGRRVRTGAVVHLRNGSTFPLDNRQIKNAHRLVERVEQRVADLLLPAYQSMFDGGQSLQFGPLTISREAIQFQQKTLPWPEVESINYFNGFIAVNARSQRFTSWAVVDASAVPNPAIFLTLVQPFVRR